MAVLALATDVSLFLLPLVSDSQNGVFAAFDWKPMMSSLSQLADMRERLGNMVIGSSKRGEPITADDLGVRLPPFPFLSCPRADAQLPPLPTLPLPERRSGVLSPS